MTKPSVRTIARQQGIDLSQLILILEHRRPADSDTEKEFVEQFLDTIDGMEQDTYGNRYIRVGTAPVMWSCHTDTVSREGGLQNIKWDGDILSLNQGKPGQSLGADDGAGMWLMLEMLKAGKEGLYIFHRDEEIGGLGSGFIARSNPDLVKDIDYALAFDRRDLGSVITHQRGERCCSDGFGSALAAALNITRGLDYKLDTGGVFTDTANYTDLIPECTNLSVGYYREHSQMETLDVAHLLRLREALLALDVSELPVLRDPSKVERLTYAGFGSWGSSVLKKKDPLDQMVDVIEDRIYSVGRWLLGMGLTGKMLDEMLTNQWRKGLHPPSNDHNQSVVEYLADRGIHDENDTLDLEDEVEQIEALWCDDCAAWDDRSFSYSELWEGEPCSNCDGTATSVHYVDYNVMSGEVVE